MVNSRSKHWQFTWNNYTPFNILYLSSLVARVEEVVYCGWGYEVGAQGTPHLQGLLSVDPKKSMRQILDIIQSPIHVEVARDVKALLEYNEKDENYVEFGSRPVGKGHRSDLTALKNDLDKKRPLKNIADTHFSNFIRYHRGINEYRRLVSVPRDFKTLVIVYHGPTGSGKTRAVVDNATDLWSYSSDGWFDGYDQHKQVIFDDFSGSEFKLNYLLKLLDRYPMQVKVKGGFVNWAPEEIYITSNLNPTDWYKNAHQEHVNALFRRIDHIVDFDSQ